MEEKEIVKGVSIIGFSDGFFFIAARLSSTDNTLLMLKEELIKLYPYPVAFQHDIPTQLAWSLTVTLQYFFREKKLKNNWYQLVEEDKTLIKTLTNTKEAFQALTIEEGD